MTFYSQKKENLFKNPEPFFCNFSVCIGILFDCHKPHFSVIQFNKENLFL